MGDRRAKRKRPRFIWQALLILAPVLVLAKLGAYAFWRDQHLALREAEERAQQLAEEAAGRIWDELEKTDRPPIQFDRAGNLLDPKPYDRIPVPRPLSEAELTAEQRRLWNAARQTSTNQVTRLQYAPDLYAEFLKNDPPHDFAAVAHFNRGLALKDIGQRSEADQEFERILNDYPDAVSEAGLPLKALAAINSSPDDPLVRYAMRQPSALTPLIIERYSSSSNRAAFQAQWAEQEELR